MTWRSVVFLGAVLGCSSEAGEIGDGQGAGSSVASPPIAGAGMPAGGVGSNAFAAGMASGGSSAGATTQPIAGGAGALGAVGGMPPVMLPPGGATNDAMGGAAGSNLDGAGTGGMGESTGGSDPGGAAAGTGGASTVEDPMDDRCRVQPLTDEFRRDYDDLDPFYQKYALADGLPIVSSLAPADEALERACELVIDMVSSRPDVLEALVDNYIRFAIIAEDELTNDIPEFDYLDDSINERARGLGSIPAASCAEESILCNRELDPWRGEGICVHEFAHTISFAGLFVADPTFEGRLDDAYESARAAGLFANTYAMENAQEYWAEGVQDWYFTNLESDPPNGIHNYVDRREELLEYDPTLYDLVAELLPADPQFVDCYSDE